jgi:hypothetical protein
MRPDRVCGAADHAIALARQLDRVVRHEPMAARDQLERALALAGTARPCEQNAHTADVDQHAVNPHG